MPKVCPLPWLALVGLLVPFTSLPTTHAEPTGDTQRWSADVTLDGVMRVPPGSVLEIGPGTRIHGVGSLEVDGRLVVRGTEAAPVEWTTNVVLAPGSEATVANASFEGVRADSSCLLNVRGATLALETSLFENATSALCVAAGSRLSAQGNIFRFDGFALYAERPTLAATPGCASDAKPCMQEVGGLAPVGPPGARGVCWPLSVQGWACRGWGGAPALVIEEGVSATLREDHFEENYVGVQSAVTDATLSLERFVDNDVGVLVLSSAAEQAFSPRLVINASSFEHHGDPLAPPPRSPGLEAGVRIVETPVASGDVRPDPSHVGVLLTHDAFEANAVGVQVEGWRPTVAVENNTFVRNAIGFRALTGSARLVDDTFEDRVWDVYLEGLTGYVTLSGGKVDRAKVLVAGGEKLSADWGLVAGGAAFVGLAAIAAFLTENGRYLLLRFVAAPLYARARRSEMLEQPVREKMEAVVRAEPGIHLRGLVHRLGISYGATVYHLTRLERAGFLISRRQGVHRRIFSVSQPFVLPLPPTTRDRILGAIHATPGVSQGDVARKLGLSRQLMSHHLRALRAQGRIRVDRRWGTNFLYATDREAVDAAGTSTGPRDPT